MSEGLHIHGGCHCRALRFDLAWPADTGAEVVVPSRKCGCSFCTRFDGSWTSHPEAKLEITQAVEHPPIRYQFGTKTADFIICSHCGMTPLVVCSLDGVEYAVVNTNTFDESEEPGYRLSYATTDFEGEETQERLARRKARWIRKVDWKLYPA